MSKNIQNDETNDVQPKNQKGYSLRERTSSKKNLNYIKLNLEGDNDSYDSSMLKKKDEPQNILLLIALNVVSKDAEKNFMIVVHSINTNLHMEINYLYVMIVEKNFWIIQSSEDIV